MKPLRSNRSRRPARRFPSAAKIQSALGLAQRLRPGGQEHIVLKPRRAS